MDWISEKIAAWNPMTKLKQGVNWLASFIPSVGQAATNATQPLTAAPASSAVPRANGNTQNNNATVAVTINNPTGSAEEIAKKTAEAVERNMKRAMKEAVEQGDSYVMY